MRDFSVLSDVEFEELAADLMAAELGIPVERFAAGSDGGVDLRWQVKGIGQCKHYSRSTFSQLRKAARMERQHVETLSPRDYRFITTFDLSVTQKRQIYSIFSPWMLSEDAVIGGRDIDGLITRHQEIERQHPKLWLATGTQLFWSLHSDIANRTSALQTRIAKSLPQYVLNQGYERARTLLDEHRVCVIAGVPGIGKTMLAHVLVAHAMTLGYEPVEVSADIEEAWSALDSSRPQIFFYDDFLGELSFAERLGKNEDRRLSAFIDKVRSTNTKLVLMTTREYVLKAAQQDYERLSAMDRRLHFVLALSDYTRVDRARILYNHLWHGNISPSALKEIASGGYKQIVDHSGYSPRLIEYCTSDAFDKTTHGYPGRVAAVLSHPSRLWRTAFEKHLGKIAQLLAVAMATLPPRTPLEDVERAHDALCSSLLLPHTTSDFRSSLGAMEGTFLSLERAEDLQVLELHNPSIRDFVLDWLSEDSVLLGAVVTSAVFFEQLRQLYSYAFWSGIEGGTRPSLTTNLARYQKEFTVGVVRTLHGPSPERRTQWTNRGNVYGPPRGWFEERINFCLSLDRAWKPDDDWILAQVQTLAERWQRGEGIKSKAVELLRDLGMTLYEFPYERRSEFEEAAEHAGKALDSWLRSSLEETEEDWVPLFDRFEKDHQANLSEDRALVGEFENYVREELINWSPCPPNLDMLLSYAEKLKVRPGILDDIQDAIRQDEERDKETARTVDRDTTKPADVGASGSDEALGNLFRRLVY